MQAWLTSWLLSCSASEPDNECGWAGTPQCAHPPAATPCAHTRQAHADYYHRDWAGLQPHTAHKGSLTQPHTGQELPKALCLSQHTFLEGGDARHAQRHARPSI